MCVHLVIVANDMFTIKSDFKSPQKVFQIEGICIYYSLDISQLQRNYNLTKSKSTLTPEWATISLSEWLRYKYRHQMLATCEQVNGRMPPAVRWTDTVTLENCSSLLTLLSIYTPYDCVFQTVCWTKMHPYASRVHRRIYMAAVSY